MIRTVISAARVILLVCSIPAKGEDEISECMNFIYSFVVVAKREEVGKKKTQQVIKILMLKSTKNDAAPPG